MNESYIDISKGYICELCQIRFTSEESFVEHLKEHSRQEVEALKELAELSLKDEEAYDTLCWELIRMEYFERQKESKGIESEGKE